MNFRTAVFISGRGSNLQAMLDLSEFVRVSLVVSSKEFTWGRSRARRTGVPVITLPPKIDWQELQNRLSDRGINQIFLLGFMKLVPVSFIDNWKGRVWNLHPSLLPNFPGMHAIEKSFLSDRDMGVTIHEVTEGMDEGPRVLQATSVRALQKPQLVNLQRSQMLISRDEQKMVRMFSERRLSC